MPLRFEKRLIAAERFESAAFIDVNNDGIPDIVSGEWWYEGPEFRIRHRVGTVKSEGEYFDDFSTLPMDINGDGFMDFVTGGWWGNSIRWRQNPGATDAEWPEHIIAECGNVETTRAWDVDRDGVLELVPNTPNGPLVVYKLASRLCGEGKPAFEAHTVFEEAQGHGLGFGDVSGSGRGDFVLRHGWLEAPADPFGEPWNWHPEFSLRSASVPILVTDLTGNGLGDLIVGQSHAYGLSWWEQSMVDGEREWTEHVIDADNSQYHDLHWIDIDGDGACELVTGKRFRAHCGRDPGSTDPVGIYYFKWTGEGFTKQVVNYGRPLEATGCGIYFDLADVTGNGLPDILAPGKDGLYVFYNLGCDAW